MARKHPMHGAHIEGRLGRLREILDEESYGLCCGPGDIVHRLTSAQGREVCERAWLAGQRLGDRQKSLLLLFFFGSEVPKQAVEAVLPVSVCSALVELGLLLESGSSFRARDCSILPFEGWYLFAPQLLGSFPGNPLYLGTDSLRLVETVQRSRPTRTFEIGAGTGIVGLAGARGAYAASEIDPWCALVAQASFALNGQTGRCRVTLGDLYEGCPADGADFVVSNPPYVPEPPGLGLPTFAAGGGDGLRLVRRILEEAPAETSCTLVLRAYGGAHGTRLEEELRRLTPGRRAEVWYSSRSRLRDADFTALALGAGVPDSAAAFADHYRRAGFSHQYDAVATVRSGSRPELSVVHAHDGWDDDTVPVRTGPGPAGEDPAENSILAAVDGCRTVAEIAAFLGSESGWPDRTIEKTLAFCRQASLAGFLRPSPTKPSDL